MIDTPDSTPRPAGRTLIVGLGTTGLSCARFLSRQGIEVAVTDSRERPPALEAIRAELPDVALFLGGFDRSAFSRATRIVVSPGVSLRDPLLLEARRRGVEIIGDIELFARHARAPVVAITGSNGKSTVTTLVGAMARRAGREVRVGGNLGTPALELIQEREPDLYVLELSSFQLETVSSLRPRVATVLNLSPDHLDRHASMDDYAGAKRRVYADAEVQVVNRDDADAAALAEAGGSCIGFGLGPARAGDFGIAEHEGERWIMYGEEPWMAAAALRMAGTHNLANALAALALGMAAGLPRDAMLLALREFRGLPHRSQWVAERGGVDWYNDSKATNIGATLAAVRGFDVPLVLIAGGQGKGADFRPLVEGLRGRVRAVILIGEAAGQIESLLQGVVPCQRATGMEDAVRKAAALAVPGDAVLLSPACASFDQFDGYEQRGEAFVRAVGELES
ncbi:MAG TPA: UDP-N-acetylmuramoyl-L-alanine--D-glutamate ligase [Gammaproteobacteria bacterium]|nr:UDP-N-acetylmuramoyl-L-alanine--D-glutamate ligase [Gammaproteobacteria bacterium]